MFDDLLRMKEQVDAFLKEARTVLESVRTSLDTFAKECGELKERVNELHGAHETILGFIADVDDDAHEELAQVATDAAATAAAAAATSVAAAASVEAAAETVAAAVEETLPEETPPEENAVPEETAEEKAAREKREAEEAEAAKKAAGTGTEPPVPVENKVPASSAAPPSSEPPERQRRRTLI